MIFVWFCARRNMGIATLSAEITYSPCVKMFGVLLEMETDWIPSNLMKWSKKEINFRWLHIILARRPTQTTFDFITYNVYKWKQHINIYAHDICLDISHWGEVKIQNYINNKSVFLFIISDRDSTNLFNDFLLKKRTSNCLRVYLYF